MSNRILLIFEGARTEPLISSTLKNLFFKTMTVIECIYGAEIYQIYKDLEEDEYLDIFNLVKERMSSSSDLLDGFIRSDFAEIYLFFDYDGHSSIAADYKLAKLIEFFNEETERGKLFISYPMVEALKHVPDELTFKDLKVECKVGINYKCVVHKETPKVFRNFDRFSHETWMKLISFHLKKMNYIVNDLYSLPEDIISQEMIFSKQVEKYIDIDYTVAVLSAFPLLIHHYYGDKDTKKMIV